MPCLWPSPERGRIIAARPGSPMWIARPVGISSVCARLEDERRVEAGAQVEAGAAGGRIGRQLLGDARVEDLQVDGGHARRRRATRREVARAVARLSVEARGDLGDQLARERRACRRAAARARRARRPASARCRRWPKVAGPRLPTISGTFLRLDASRARARAGRRSRRRSRRRTAASAGARDGGEDVGVLGQLERRRGLLAVLLDLAARRARPARQSATAAVATKTSCRGAAASTASCISAARVDVDAAHAARRRQVHRAGDQRDVGAGLGAPRARSRSPSCRSSGW